MKTKIEDWDESFLEVEDYQVERALTNGALDAIYRARRFGTDFVVEEDGKTRSLGPDETAPYEKHLIEMEKRYFGKLSFRADPGLHAEQFKIVNVATNEELASANG